MNDYQSYHMTRMEFVRYGLLGASAGFFILFLFYGDLWAVCVPGSFLAGTLFICYQKRELAKKSQWNLMLEFKDAMDSFVAALVAGYSMENAVREAYRDLKLMYGKDTPMLRELERMLHKLSLKESLDELLLDLGRRSGVKDIVTFGQIYATARKSGGNLVQVMKRTAENISEKVEVKREIQTKIAGKKMEANCMMLVPFSIILYLRLCSPGFLDPLYHGIAGRGFMTICLIFYGASVVWSQSIMNIQI